MGLRSKTDVGLRSSENSESFPTVPFDLSISNGKPVYTKPPEPRDPQQRLEPRGTCVLTLGGENLRISVAFVSDPLAVHLLLERLRVFRRDLDS